VDTRRRIRRLFFGNWKEELIGRRWKEGLFRSPGIQEKVTSLKLSLYFNLLARTFWGGN